MGDVLSEGDRLPYPNKTSWGSVGQIQSLEWTLAKTGLHLGGSTREAKAGGSVSWKPAWSLSFRTARTKLRNPVSKNINKQIPGELIKYRLQC